jgi:hypothetical protein
MKPITEELISSHLVECYEGTTLERTPDSWVITTPAGRKIKIHDYYIDFRGITKLLPGEARNDNEQWRFELMSLAVEAWGVVSLISCHDEKDGSERGLLWLYAKCYKLPVDSPAFPFSSTQAKNHFGDQATVKLRLGGFRIDVGHGTSAFIGFNPEKELMITKAVGGGAVLEAAMRLVEEVQGYVIVAGSKETIISGMAHGETRGIEVIPELYITQGHYIRVGMGIGAIIGPVAFGVGVATSAEIGFAVYFGVGLIAQWVWISLFLGNGRTKARERGQALKGNHPSGGIDRRRSSLEDARSRGML